MAGFVKEVGKAFVLGVLVFLVRNFIFYINGNSITIGNTLYMDFFYNQIFAVVLYLSNSYSVNFMLEKHKEKLFEFKNLVFAFVVSVGVSMLAIFIIRYFIRVIGFGMTYTKFIETETLTEYNKINTTYWLVCGTNGMHIHF